MRVATNSCLLALRGSGSPVETPKTGSRTIRSTCTRWPINSEISSPAVDSLRRQSPPALPHRRKSRAAPALAKTGRVSPRGCAARVSTSNRLPSQRAMRYHSRDGPSRRPASRGEICAALTTTLLHEDEVLVPQVSGLPAPLLVVLQPGTGVPLLRLPVLRGRDAGVDGPTRARDLGTRPYVCLSAVAPKYEAFGTPVVHLPVGDLADLVVSALVLDHLHLATSSRWPAADLSARGRPSFLAGFANYRIPPSGPPEHLAYTSGSNYPSRAGEGS